MTLVDVISISSPRSSGRRQLAFGILLFVFAPLLSTARAEPPQDQVPPLRVDVDLVNLTTTVLDENGRHVAGLTAKDFRIYEDGVLQKIAVVESEDVPASIGVVFDTSGSMVDKIDDVQDAVKHFVNLVNPDDEIFLMRFSSDVQLAVDFTSDRIRLGHAIDRLHPRGATLLYDATAQALQKIQEGRYKRKALLLITDGNDTASRLDLDGLLYLATKAEVLIYGLGIGHGKAGSFGHAFGAFKDEVDMQTLNALADASGGRSYLLEQAHSGKIDRIDLAVKEVAAELRQQYNLAYYPSNSAKDGSYRKIRVETLKPDYAVRTRNGYYAAKTGK